MFFVALNLTTLQHSTCVVYCTLKQYMQWRIQSFRGRQLHLRVPPPPFRQHGWQKFLNLVPPDALKKCTPWPCLFLDFFVKHFLNYVNWIMKHSSPWMFKKNLHQFFFKNLQRIWSQIISYTLFDLTESNQLKFIFTIIIALTFEHLNIWFPIWFNRTVQGVYRTDITVSLFYLYFLAANFTIYCLNFVESIDSFILVYGMS